MAEATTTLAVSPDVRDRVKALKRGGESYNEVVKRLLEVYERES